MDDPLSVLGLQPGASPEEVESLVTREIEEVVNTVDGIDELRSVSGAGSSRCGNRVPISAPMPARPSTIGRPTRSIDSSPTWAALTPNPCSSRLVAGELQVACMTRCQESA